MILRDVRFAKSVEPNQRTLIGTSSGRIKILNLSQTGGVPMTTGPGYVPLPDPNDENHVIRIIDVIQPEHIEGARPIPVFTIDNVADQRKWCRATQSWLEQAEIPAAGCPTNNLSDDGSCQRSPSGGRCLLLLPFDHPDWRPALREMYSEEFGGFMLRDQPADPPVHRQPIALEELER